MRSLLLVAISLGLGRCTSVEDAASLVQKTAELAAPKTIAEETAKARAEVKSKYQSEILWQKLWRAVLRDRGVRDSPAWLEQVFGTLMSGNTALLRSKLKDGGKAVVDGILSMDLSTTDWADLNSISQVMGQLSTVCNRSGFTKSAQLWRTMQVMTPPAVRASVALPAVAKQLKQDFWDKRLPPMSVAAAEDFSDMFGAAWLEASGAGMKAYSDAKAAVVEGGKEAVSEVKGSVSKVLQNAGLDKEYAKYGFDKEVGQQMAKLKPLVFKAKTLLKNF